MSHIGPDDTGEQPVVAAVSVSTSQLEEKWLKPRSRREWMMILTIALTVMAAILLPVYVVRSVHNDTQEIVNRLEQELVIDTESRIAVNVATIACIAEQPEGEAFESAVFETCIRRALNIIDE